MAHPDVIRPPSGKKELRYFNRFGVHSFTDDDITRYHELFPRPPGRRTGEWTPSYITDHWVPAQMDLAAPLARFLLMLRDPLERYRSGLAQMEIRHRAGLDHRRSAFMRGCYATQIERWRAWFPESQMQILQYERCVQQPKIELAKTYAFLDLDPTYEPPHIDWPVHAPIRPPVPLPDDRKNELRRAYEPEIARLVKLVPDLDLDLWPSAINLAR